MTPAFVQTLTQPQNIGSLHMDGHPVNNQLSIGGQLANNQLFHPGTPVAPVTSATSLTSAPSNPIDYLSSFGHQMFTNQYGQGQFGAQSLGQSNHLFSGFQTPHSQPSQEHLLMSQQTMDVYEGNDLLSSQIEELLCVSGIEKDHGISA